MMEHYVVGDLHPFFEGTDASSLFPELHESNLGYPPLVQQILSSSSSSPSSEELDSPVQYIGKDDGHMGTSLMEVHLQHKPRGSKGVWQNIEPGQRIRVTKGKGKRLRLEIKVNYQVTDPNMTVPLFLQKYKMDSLELQLIDLENPQIPTLCSDGFSVESTKTFKNMAEVELKLYKVFCKKLQFTVQIPAVNGEPLIGSSAEFATHNSGTLGTVPMQVTTKEKIKTELSTTTDVSPSEGENASIVPVPSATNSPNQAVNMTTSLTEVNKRRRVDQQQEQPPDFDNSAVTVIPGSLDVKGFVRARGYMQFSDIRLKTNFEDIVDAIDIVTRLKGQVYEWKSGVLDESQSGGNKVIGLIAQQVQQILPEVVHEDPVTGYLSVSYAEILPVLIEAFNQFLKDYNKDKEEQQTQIVALRSQLDHLTAQFQSAEKQRYEDVQILINQTRVLSHQLLAAQRNRKAFYYPYPIQAQLKPFPLPPELKNEKGFSLLCSNFLVSQYRSFYYSMGLLFCMFILCILVGTALMVSYGTHREPTGPQVGSMWSVGFAATTGPSADNTRALEERTPPVTTGTTGTTGRHSTTALYPINGMNWDDPPVDLADQSTPTGFVAGVVLLVGGFLGISVTLLLTFYRYRKDRAHYFSEYEVTNQ